MTTHEMFDGRLQIYKRGEGRVWQCAARVGGKRFRSTTGEEGLDRAKDVAEEWYLDLRGKLRGGEIVPDEKTFAQAAEGYLRELKVLTIGTRSPKYVALLELRMKKHILPFFGDKPLSAVNRGLVQSYRVKRAEEMRLEIRDVKIEDDYGTRKTILVIDVRGKTGTGFAKSMPGAVQPFQRLRQRRTQQLKAGGMDDKAVAKALPTTRVFPSFNRDMFNTILDEEGLKFDRDGQRRTAYSLRHTYISMRLMEGANIHQVANNCRTSVQMIEQFYAAHIKDRLDASAINVQRPKPARKAARRRTTQEEQPAP